MVRENRPRILVVDDVADTANSLALVLRLWGYGAEACYSGSAALAAARTYQPQVVLLDIGMPGMDGFQVAQRLRAEPRVGHAVLIAITGHTNEACRIRARWAGFYRYLLKPVDPGHLRELLIRLVGYPELLRTPQVDKDEVLQDSPPLGKGLRAQLLAPGAIPAGEPFSLMRVAL